MELVKRSAASDKAIHKNAQLPAFLNKLYTMVSDSETDRLIHWSSTGDSFLVPHPDQFARELLPRYFKHSNFGSFVRQLNMYGFSKVLNVSAGVLDRQPSTSATSETLEFRNDNFQRGQPDLLHLIHRKKSGQGHGHPEEKALLAAIEAEDKDGSALAVDLRTLLSEVAAIRKHQTSISSDLKELSVSNKQLWNEAIESRTRHQQHQATINKIVRFLGTVFGGKVLEQQGGVDLAPSPGSSPSASTSATTAVPGSPAPKRRLLIKGREDDKDYAGGATIQEIEVPATEDMDLPVIISPTLQTSYPSTSLAPTSIDLSSLPPPFDFASDSPFSLGSGGSITSAPLPSPSALTKINAQDAEIKHLNKDYTQLASQMDNLQNALNRIMAGLPPDLAASLTQPQDNIVTDQSAADPSFDLDQIMSQFPVSGASDPTMPVSGYPWPASDGTAPLDWNSLLSTSSYDALPDSAPYIDGSQAAPVSAYQAPADAGAAESVSELFKEFVQDGPAEEPRIWETASRASSVASEKPATRGGKRRTSVAASVEGGERRTSPRKKPRGA